MQERLRRREEKFRGLLEAAPDAIVIVNRQGQIVLVNRQAEMMFGYARSDTLVQAAGVPRTRAVPCRLTSARRQAYLAAPRTRRMGTVHGLAGRQRNATEFPVDISLGTLETDEGTLVIAFVREVPERDRIA